MAVIGYHASHEQFPPSQLKDWVIKAEEAGFQAINSSDHFNPWSERQGQSGFSFAWLGAVMEATSLPFGMVCAPGQRYHPAIVAQAAATLAEMFEGRFSMALGSGEALNERITGERWPSKQERNERLLECVRIMRGLLAGDTVTHSGKVKVDSARLYTRPRQKPMLLAAALTPETAGWAGEWADGLITINQSLPRLRDIVETFRRGGGQNKPLHLKLQLSYHQTDEAALAGAYDQWRNNILPEDQLGDIWKVEDFDRKGDKVRPEDLHEFVHISADMKKHIAWIRQYIDLGFEQIILHNVNREQAMFIKDFGGFVLPALKGFS
ncbi:MAG: TIGR03885 family FMN-dependent LLM class oxidoreductase [Sphingobacteriales bacterium]|nr:MAG: TIGR03885 family FMN-dependent LLM class oxidoreductase [Sphingobacteriales bacterium]